MVGELLSLNIHPPLHRSLGVPSDFHRYENGGKMSDVPQWSVGTYSRVMSTTKMPHNIKQAQLFDGRSRAYLGAANAHTRSR
jgi:hypothetical protein